MAYRLIILAMRGIGNQDLLRPAVGGALRPTVLKALANFPSSPSSNEVGCIPVMGRDRRSAFLGCLERFPRGVCGGDERVNKNQVPTDGAGSGEFREHVIVASRLCNATSHAEHSQSYLVSSPTERAERCQLRVF